MYATAEYILPLSKLKTEKPNLVASDRGARLLDIAVNVDASPDPNAPTKMKYSVFGSDLTFASIPPTYNSHTPDTDIQTKTTATADTHLGEYERRKFTRANKREEETGRMISGEMVTRELLAQPLVMMPWAVGPLGRLGPMLRRHLHRKGCH